jgi:hypothetical protein
MMMMKGRWLGSLWAGDVSTLSSAVNGSQSATNAGTRLVGRMIQKSTDIVNEERI